ncbi:MAG: hypothetical protein II939_10180 [Bacteroidales bacterium]|nr:hypothetical protein [Bacteroidales bacterium]
MASAGKIIGVTAAVGVVGLGTYILITKAMEIDSLIKNIQFSVSVSKVRLEGYSHLKVYINVSIINPTKLSFKFEKPTVWIYFNGSSLASSKQSTEKVKIEPQGTSTIRNIELSIPILSNISTFLEIGRKLFNKTFKSVEGFVNQIQNNLNSILPLLSVTIKTYIGKTPIEYSTQLSSTTEEK